MTKWLGKAVSICSIAQTDDFSAKKQFLREIFGLNLFFNKQKCRRKRRPISNPLKNPWFALRATKEKTARLGDNFIEKSELERFFEFARTYFNTKHKAQPRRQRGQARCQCPDKTKNPLIFLRFSPTNFFFES